MGYVTLKITCGKVNDAKTIKFNYLVLDIMSLYNVTLGRPNPNSLAALVSTRYLSMKYLLLDGIVGTTRGDRQVAR